MALRSQAYLSRRGVTVINRWLWKPLAAIAAMAALAPAHAQMRYRGMPDPHGDMERNPGQRQAEPPREFQQRQEFMNSNRFSPEERRQLRRDIHEAGRELYQGKHPQR